MRQVWDKWKRDTKHKGGLGKKLFFPAVLFLFLFTLSIAAGAGEVQETLAQTGEASVTMSVSYGYGDEAKGDRYLPVRISLENQETADFNGTLEVLTTASSREVYRYDYPVQIGAGETSEEVYYIPLGVKGDQLFVTLCRENGSELIKKRVKLNISSDMSEVFIGVFCDVPDSLLYFDGVGIRLGSLKTKVVSLDSTLAPEDQRGYDQFDILMITDYSLEALTKVQQDALMQWVEDGGTLLFGGGGVYKSTMGSFADELLENPNAVPELREINLGAEYSQNAPEDAVLKLMCADLSLNNGSILLAGDEFPLLSYVHRKDGRIAVTAFDLQDIEEFCEEHPAFTEKLLLLTLGDTNIEMLSQMDYFGFSSLYFSAQGLINTGNVDRLPKVPVYTIIMILYVFLIGPGLYIILKRKSLQRFYIGSVALCALIFTAVIYAIGTKTRFREPFFTYATILDASEENPSEETFINVRSPFNKPYTVALKPEYTVRPITKSYYYDAVSAAEFTGSESYKTAIAAKEDRTELKIRDTAAFTPKIFSLEKRSGSVGEAGIEGEISFFEGKVSGIIINRFDYRLEDATILLYGRALVLGDIEPGQEMRLENAETLYYPLNYTYAFTQVVTGAEQYEKADINDEAYMLAQERTRLLSFYMDNMMDEYTPEARLVAFSPDKNKKEFLAQGDYITEGITLVTAPVTVENEQDGRIYRSALEQSPNVISGNYQARYNSMYTGEPSEPAVLEYSLGNDMALEKLIFTALSPEFRNNPKYPYVTAFQGKMYFYNYDTGRNDPIDEKKTEFGAEELVHYLSPGNTITIKYVSEDTSEYGWDKLLPMIYAVGRGK